MKNPTLNLKKSVLSALVLASISAFAQPTPSIKSVKAVVSYEKNTEKLSPQTLQELPQATFTEQSGQQEFVYQESSTLVKNSVRNVSYKVTTTTTTYSDKSVKTVVSREVVQDYVTSNETAEASRKLVATNTVSPTALQAQQAITNTPEYKSSTGLAQIKAYAAWQQGWTGRGVTVAVVDSGFSDKQTTDRPLNMLPGKTFVVNNTNTHDEHRHGTHVTGIIAAPLNGVGVVGVAYNSTILPVKVLNAGLAAPMPQVAQGVLYAAQQNAHVINLSISKNYTYESQGSTAQFNTDFGQAYLTAVQSGSTVVTAAGNLGSKCNTFVNGYTTAYAGVKGYTTTCGFPAALPLVQGYESLIASKGGWIAVGAVDADNSIATYSNKAGATKQWYLVAPGTAINSTVANNKTGTLTGTSMAAPYVSGAVALLTEKFPQLTGAQVSEILFKTASDLGAPGIDDVYGWGMLNLERAMQPVGQLKLKNTQAPVQAISVNAALAPSLARAASLTQVLGTDDYQRGFSFNALATAQQTQGFDFAAQPIYQTKNLFVSQTPLAQVLGFQVNPNTRVLLAQDAAGTYTSFGYHSTVHNIGGTLDSGTLKASAQQLVEFSKVNLLGATLYKNFGNLQLGTRVPLTPISGSFRVTQTGEVFGVVGKPQPPQFWVKHSAKLSRSLSVVSYATSNKQANVNFSYNY